MKPRFFRTQEEFGAWLERNYHSADELWVGFYKKSSGRKSITWPEAVDEALRFGWIDGVRKRIDDERYTNRFTPRRPTSNWSLRNIDRVRELTELGLMHPAGLKAFAERADERSALYSYEQRRAATLAPDHEREFKRNRKAWVFFESCPPSYRKSATHWVMSAKREETQRRRLSQLIEDSATGRRVPPLTPPSKR